MAAGLPRERRLRLRAVSERHAAVTSFIGLGSNQGDGLALLQSAVRDMQRLADTRVTHASPLYRSKPMGFIEQTDFFNAVVALETGLAPEALLNELQVIETTHGRVRHDGVRWGPRTLDLDILVYGDQILDTERLRVPHSGIAERSFVLIPWMDIAPDVMIPGLGLVRSLASRFVRTELELLTTSWTPL